MSSSIISKETAESLKCETCLNLLSVPGVTISKDNERYTCGRCSNADDSTIHAYAYETLASTVKFPCRYSEFGCNKQLSWGSVMDHEKACKHRVYKCFGKQCNWCGNLESLKLHIQASHKRRIMSRGFFYVVTSDTSQFYILYAHDEMFQVQTSMNALTFCLSVKYVGRPSDCGRFTCNVELRNKNNAINIYDGNMRAYSDYEEYWKYIDVECDDDILTLPGTKCFITITEEIPKKMKKVKVPVKTEGSKNDEVQILNKQDKKMLKQPNKEKKDLIAVKKEIPTVNEANSKRDVTKNIQNSILKEIECPVCQEFMYPPIYQCSLGHSVCCDCKPKLKKCPSCTSEYRNTRNYVLESMLQSVKLSCNNDIYGCEFIGNVVSIRDHHDKCIYENIECPVPYECNWKGALNLLSVHLTASHKKDTFISLDEIVTHSLNDATAVHYLAQLDDETFRISCGKNKSNNSVRWSFQKIFSPASSKNYKVEMEFIDQTNNNRKFIMNDIFHDVTPIKNIFNSVVLIPLALLKPYISASNVLHLKYRIYICF